MVKQLSLDAYRDDELDYFEKKELQWKQYWEATRSVLKLHALLIYNGKRTEQAVVKEKRSLRGFLTDPHTANQQTKRRVLSLIKDEIGLESIGVRAFVSRHRVEELCWIVVNEFYPHGQRVRPTENALQVHGGVIRTDAALFVHSAFRTQLKSNCIVWRLRLMDANRRQCVSQIALKHVVLVEGSSLGSEPLPGR